MQALIVDNDLQRQASYTIAFVEAGFQVTPTSSVKVAETCLRRNLIDIFVAPEKIGTKRTHSLALLAEYKNPYVSTILLTDRKDSDIDELFMLLPSLHCLFSLDTKADVLTKFAIASVSGATCAAGPYFLSPDLRIDRKRVETTFVSARTHKSPVDNVLIETAA